MSDVRLITVTFNSSDVIGPFLDSVPDTVELVVVDNASSDDTVQKVRANGSALIELPENLGFGTACNKGAAGAKTPYLFFVNPDARLEPGCIEVLVAAAEKHPKAGAFNPAILSPSGDVRLNRRSCILPRALWTDKALASSDPNISTAVHMLSGAALFCRRDAYEEIDGFDPNIFLYHEDDDLSVRMAKAGWQLRLEHSARVTHIGGAGSGNSVAAAAFKAKEIARSRLYVERKHGIAWPRLRGYGRASAKLLSPLSLLSRRKRAQAIAYFQGVRDY